MSGSCANEIHCASFFPRIYSILSIFSHSHYARLLLHAISYSVCIICSSFHSINFGIKMYGIDFWCAVGSAMAGVRGRREQINYARQINARRCRGSNCYCYNLFERWARTVALHRPEKRVVGEWKGLFYCQAWLGRNDPGTQCSCRWNKRASPTPPPEYTAFIDHFGVCMDQKDIHSMHTRRDIRMLMAESIDCNK